MQLDINKILEFIFVEFDKNPTEWILFGCLIVLFLVFFVLRLVFFSSKDVVARKGKPSILNSIKNFWSDKTQKKLRSLQLKLDNISNNSIKYNQCYKLQAFNNSNYFCYDNNDYHLDVQ